ncbi:hypothetical protein VX037_08490 [Gordonia sp. Z-3]|jgi:hypothetical protein|uniref:hypothetical protein n=1 Tax=unclassified Gordonia (in: high G+C Gram-positive bacteria) TaxID=2657482 RepID=UPI000C5D2DE0|nr:MULTISPECIES: hypothetical protein [unclassified Gordonia (in: high G+C Gram-positive bacteria)]MAU80986.1 hypothetical protein [Gordonia sp. (in: high G+C Gram-positive bacteria)]MED5801059.1 hypothetical protein [Gordonia sp. Z-3]
MTTLFILDVPENKPVAAVAGEDPAVTVEHLGPYFRITADDAIVVDRRATGCRHAVWYSSVAGLLDSRITQWDKDALRVEPSVVSGR